jgi:hypothetical protein
MKTPDAEVLTMNPDTILCPFCFDEIEPQAKKCRHCGEWLEEASKRPGGTVASKGSADARAVNRGLKQKEADDFAAGFGMLILIISCCVLGSWTHWIIGWGCFFAGLAWLTSWYYHE